MWQPFSRIELHERERAVLLAWDTLEPARVVGCRCGRCVRRRPFLSCLCDAVKDCARRARMSDVLCDLCVVRRDVVRAGLVGSQRARQNFKVVERVLWRHNVNVIVLNVFQGRLLQHTLGCDAGSCIGCLFWDETRRA